MVFATIFVKFHEFSNIFVDLDSISQHILGSEYLKIKVLSRPIALPRMKSANLTFSGKSLEALVFHIIATHSERTRSGLEPALLF